MELLVNVLRKLDLPHDANTLKKFEKYMEFILYWNEKVNMTSIINKDEFIKKHFVDSLVCCSFRQYKESTKIIDIGTGAGFPGIPLAIVSPEKEFLLMDSLNKRIKIVEEGISEIGIKNVNLSHGRAEELAQKKEHRESYDLCVSRAVADLSVLSEYCLPFVKVGGWFAAYKSSSAEEEIKNSLRAIRLLGGEPGSVESFHMSGYDLEHNIVFIKKIKSTLAKYPRKAGTPAKEPLK